MHEIYLQAENSRLKNRKLSMAEDERIAKIALKVVDEAMNRMITSTGSNGSPVSTIAEQQAAKESHLHVELLQRITNLESESAANKRCLAAVEELVNSELRAKVAQLPHMNEQLHELASALNKNTCSIEQLQEAELRRQKESFTLSSLVIFKEEFQEQHGMIQRKIQVLQRLVEEHVKAESEQAKLADDLRSLEHCVLALQNESKSRQSSIKHIEQCVTGIGENMERSAAQEKRYGELLKAICSTLNGQRAT